VLLDIAFDVIEHNTNNTYNVHNISSKEENLHRNHFEMRHYILTAFAVSLTAVGHTVFAQSNAGALQQQLEKQLPLPSALPLPEAVKPAASSPIETKKSQDISFILNGVNFVGADVEYVNEFQNLVKPWISQSVTIADLESLTNQIVRIYQSDGIHVLVTLPPQEIKNGIVEILITKSKLGKVSVTMPNGETRFGEKRVLAYIENTNAIGDTVNLQKIQHTLMILNETPGVIVQGQIKRGENLGETDFQVNLTQPNLFEGKVDLNNYGSEYTGTNQALVSLVANNPLGYGDQTILSVLGSQGSQYGQVAYNFPVGYSGLRLGVGSSVLTFKDIGTYAYPNGIGGGAWTVGANAAYPLLRSEGANLNLALSYDIKSYNNYLLINNQNTTAYNIKDLSFSISGNIYDSFLGGATSAGNLAFIVGYLDSIYPSRSFDFTPPANFNKATFSANRIQALNSSGDTSLYIAATGQYSSANLSSAEQFYLGGPYGVRAYPVAQGAGAQGALGTIELRQKLLQQFLSYAFFDTGIVQQFKNTFFGWQGLTNANNTYSLSGAGVGMKWIHRDVILNAMVAWRVGSNPLYTQNGQSVNSDGTNKNPQAWFSGSLFF